MHLIHTWGTPKAGGESMMKQESRHDARQRDCLACCCFPYEWILSRHCCCCCYYYYYYYTERGMSVGTWVHQSAVSLWWCFCLGGQQSGRIPKQPRCLFYLSFSVVSEYGTLKYILWTLALRRAECLDSWEMRSFSLGLGRCSLCWEVFGVQQWLSSTSSMASCPVAPLSSSQLPIFTDL